MSEIDKGIEIMLGDFCAVAARKGTPKERKVSEIKKRPPWLPMTDFYKQLREGITRVHREGSPKESLMDMVPGLTDRKKGSYEALIKGYIEWWAGRNLVWFKPPRAVHVEGDVMVTLNPEVGVLINGQPHIIKLFLKKSDKLTPEVADKVTSFMELALREEVQPNAVMCILDVRKGTLYVGSPLTAKRAIAVKAELVFISKIWARDDEE